MATIESVDFFYLAMPQITLDVDGSQDALLVRVTSGGIEGWGECEAAPLVSIASFVCPPSHGACQPVGNAVLGAELNDVADIFAIADAVRYFSMDLLQAVHTWSGIEMALWDLLGKRQGRPVWSLLGYSQAMPKRPYASLLFGEDPADTFRDASKAAAEGFTAIKLGWGAFGKETIQEDADQLHAAREGIGAERDLMIDAGQIWGDDVDRAVSRLPILESVRAIWLEEPFIPDAFHSWATLSGRSKSVRLAGGEAAHNAEMAINLIDYAKVGFIQIDCGRIGGLGPAKRVADHAVNHGVIYVNHTFTSFLALSASIQPYAGLKDHDICEYPGAPKALATCITNEAIKMNRDGAIHLPFGPGLGVTVNENAIKQYLVDVEIKVNRSRLFPPMTTGTRSAL